MLPKLANMRAAVVAAAPAASRAQLRIPTTQQSLLARPQRLAVRAHAGKQQVVEAQQQKADLRSGAAALALAAALTVGGSLALDVPAADAATSGGRVSSSAGFKSRKAR